MLNFWSNTTQKIYEFVYGPRTKDTEFENKVEEMKACERSISGIKHIYFNFSPNTRGIKNLCKDIYANIGMAYSESSPYWAFVVELGQVYQEVERLYDGMSEVVALLAIQTSEWDKLFEEAKKAVAQREETRRAYDHYDEKLEKLVKNRNEKMQKGIGETPKEIERFDRNDLKFKKATDDYIRQSQATFGLMCELLDYRYKLINPHLIKFLTEQQKFVAAVNDLFKKFDNLQVKFQSMDRSLKKSGIDYDPRKYVRGHKLLQGVNVRDLPDLSKKSDKFSYEDYLKSKGQNPGNMGGGINRQPTGINTQNQIQGIGSSSNASPYSYEQFLQNKMTKSVTNSMNNMNTDSNMNFTFNNNKLDTNSSNYNDFQQFNNNYSNNFKAQSSKSISVAQPEELRKTTILPQEDFSLFNKEQEKDTFNPYSSLTFNDFNPGNRSAFPQMGQINPQSQSQFPGRSNMNMGNRPPNTQNINYPNNSMNFPR